MRRNQSKMKQRRVYLYRCKDHVRGWMPYVQHSERSTPTLEVLVNAESNQKAKNKAVTLLNRAMSGVDIGNQLTIVKVDYDDWVFGLDNFPETKDSLARILR